MKKIDLTTKFNEKAIQLYLKMKHKQGKYTAYDEDGGRPAQRSYLLLGVLWNELKERPSRYDTFS